MTLRQWLGKKIAGSFYSKTNGSLTDQDRLNALAVRRQETAIRQAEKQVEFMERLQNIETTSNPKENVTDTLIKQALPILLAKIQGEGTQTQLPYTDGYSTQGFQPTAEVKAVEFSEQQIQALLQSNPKLKKYADKFSDEQVKEYVMQQIPNISKESLNKIIIEVRK